MGEQDATPIVGPVYGFRTWEVEQVGSKWVGKVPRLSSRGGVWTEATQQARCIRGGGIWSTDLEERHDHDPATEHGCWCGLYAHSTLARCLDDREGRLDPTLSRYLAGDRHVLGMVSASGRMIAAERGFRAQQMTVERLVCIHGPTTVGDVCSFRRPHQPHVRAIAADLGVEVVCAKMARKSLTRAFADREDVHLWKEQAPWISDVPSEPTRSSTPGSRTMTTQIAFDTTYLQDAMRQASLSIERQLMQGLTPPSLTWSGPDQPAGGGEDPSPDEDEGGTP